MRKFHFLDMDSKPSPTHHHIVFLQGAFLPVPEIQLPAPYTLTRSVYQYTTPSELHERIHDASIIVLCALKLDATALSPEVTPHLKFIGVAATGTDCIDLEACKARGIAVSNCPRANIESVSEHAISLYFATRRKLIDMHTLTRAGKWPERNTLMYNILDKHRQPPLTCQEEIVGIVGNGSVGKRIAKLARGLGMTVHISARKDPKDINLSNGVTSEERIPFETVIKQSTIIFVAIPLNESTRNMISTRELEMASHHAVIINVSRGGIVDEEAIVKALKDGRIAGAATDVFSEEPAGPTNSPLLREDTKDLNLVVTPHLAWLSQKTWVTQSQMLKMVVEEWSAGRRHNVVV